MAVAVSSQLGCEDAPPPIQGPASRAEAPSPLSTTRAPGPAAPGPQLKLGEADFKEGEASRDPFRRQLGQAPPDERGISCKKGKLRQYGLDELKLTGIVGGGARPMAMFRGPSTETVTTVKRGDRIGKSCSVVKAILRDKVIITIQVAGSSKRAERIIPLHTS